MIKDKYQEELKKSWDKLGRLNPFWAVLTSSKPSMQDITEFMDIGNRDISAICSKVRDLDCIPNNDVCLDYGCGVGRLSQALSHRFKKVIALDISDTMIDTAKKIHFDIQNINFATLSEQPLSSVSPNSIDFAISLITLQHINSRLVLSILKDIYSTLKSGGVLVFNMPSSPILPWPIVPLIRRVKYLLNPFIIQKSVPFMEMNYIEKDRLTKFLTDLGFEIKLAEPDNVSPLFKSYRYFVVKK